MNNLKSAKLIAFSFYFAKKHHIFLKMGMNGESRTLRSFSEVGFWLRRIARDTTAFKPLSASFFCIVFFLQMSSKPLIISFEGNTGAGKSTLLKIAAQHFNACVGKKFSDVLIQSPLFQEFLKDKKRWAYTVSHLFLTMRLDVINRAVRECDGGLVMLERSPYSQLFAFAKLFFDEGSMNLLEWQIFKKESELLIELNPKPDGIIYVRTPPLICLERANARNSQLNLPLFEYDFLQKLNICHEDWLINNNLVSPLFKNIPVLVIDGMQDFVHDEQIARQYIQKISELIQSLA
jgi:deoxyadenosine/deoxycytidine kinase